MHQKPSRPHLTATLLGWLLAATLATVAVADPTGETAEGWRIRFYAAAVDQEHGSADLARPAGTATGFNTGVGGGLGINAEYRFSARLGVDLGLFAGGSVGIEAGTYHDGENAWVTYDSLAFTPLTLGLDIHLTPDSRVDFYAGPLVALIRYGSLAARSSPTGPRAGIDFDEDFALGAGLGLGVPLGTSRWSFQANVTYLDGSLEGRGTNGVRVSSGYDSTIVGLGFGYRFKPRSG